MVQVRSPAPYGGVPKWPKGADCKSVVSDFGGSNPPSSTKKPSRLREGFSYLRSLCANELCVEAVCSKELFVCALFGNSSVMENENDVAVTYR
jgi:hypothetical protein